MKFRCLLCDSKPAWGCFFIPKNSREWGTTAGIFQRVVHYWLCHRCGSIPVKQRNRHVEAMIADGLKPVSRN